MLFVHLCFNTLFKITQFSCDMLYQRRRNYEERRILSATFCIIHSQQLFLSQNHRFYLITQQHSIHTHTHKTTYTTYTRKAKQTIASVYDIPFVRFVFVHFLLSLAIQTRLFIQSPFLIICL